MKGTTLNYYKKKEDPVAKGSIDLTTGRGVRSKKETKGVEWPDEAKNNVSFAVAIEGRTYYLYGTDVGEIRLDIHIKINISLAWLVLKLITIKYFDLTVVLFVIITFDNILW